MTTKTSPARIDITLMLRIVVIIGATLWVYSPAFHGGWLWDDIKYLPENPLLHDPARLWKIWFEPGHRMEYYPIESTVQFAQWTLWKNNTLGYHLTSVILHAVSALLVWRLLAKIGVRLAWWGGLIFAVHPMMVESVAWVVELKNTLSLPPLLLAMCLYIDYDERKSRLDYLLVLGLFVVSMLCKSTGMMLPPVLLLYAWWNRGHVTWIDVKLSAPFFGISLVLGLLGLGLMVQFNVAPTSPVSVSALARLDTIGREMILYVIRFLYPVDLLPVYPSGLVTPTLGGLLPWLLTGGVLYGSWLKRDRWGKHVLLGLGFFLLNMVPTLGSIYASLPNMIWSLDHMFYVPSIGLIGLIVAGAGRLQQKIRPALRPGVSGVLAILVALLALECRWYVGFYQNEEVFWRYTLRNFSNSAVAHDNLGHYLLRNDRLQEAVDQLGQSLQIDRTSAIAFNNLGNALRRQGRPEEAREQFRQAVKLDPKYAEAHNNLGNSLLQTGQISEAISQLEEAVRLRPNYADAHNGLGNALVLNDQIPQAIEEYKASVRINPDLPEAHNGLGNALLQTGQLPEAREQCQEALRLNPNYTDAYCTLGLIEAQLGQIPEAIDCFKKAVQLAPNNAKIRKGLEWVESLQKDGAKTNP
jgi:tetratricopeptide (TPR) repeat protein